MVLCLSTMIFVWLVLYMSFSVNFFKPDPGDAFASVEYIMRDVPNGWLFRYISETFGWLVGLIYFWTVWLLSWRFLRKTDEKI